MQFRSFKAPLSLLSSLEAGGAWDGYCSVSCRVLPAFGTWLWNLLPIKDDFRVAFKGVLFYGYHRQPLAFWLQFVLGEQMKCSSQRLG